MMKRKYFKNVHCIQELRSEYKKLLKIHHPDNGGNVEIMQEINAEYDFLFGILPNVKMEENPEEGPKANQTYHKGMTDTLKEVIKNVSIIPGIDIEICGSWIWVSGNTYPVRDRLKELNFKFSSKKKMWYFREEMEGSYHKFRGKKEMSMGSIRFKYGSEHVENTRQAAIA